MHIDVLVKRRKSIEKKFSHLKETYKNTQEEMLKLSGAYHELGELINDVEASHDSEEKKEKLLDNKQKEK